MTAVSILTPPRPKVGWFKDPVCYYTLQSVNVALVCCETFEQVQSVFMTSRGMLGEILSGKFINCLLLTGGTCY